MARDLRFLVKDLEATTVSAVQDACVEIMNGLAQAGPGYTGEFSSAWYAVPEGGNPGGPRGTGRIYRYDRRHVPKVRFKQGTFYRIVNGSDHAAEAMDLIEGRFESQLDQNLYPIKTPEAVGKRTGQRRGEVESGEGFAISTAPLDWYVNYNVGGALRKDLKRGMSLGFSRSTLKPRGFGQ